MSQPYSSFGWQMLFPLMLLPLVGCQEGLDPPDERFFNPTAMALDPGGKFLLVANADFPKEYTDATLNAINLERVREAVQGAKAEEDDGQPVVINDAIMADRTVRISPYAARMKISPNGQVAYVSTRGKSIIYAMQLHRNERSGQLEQIDCGGANESLQHCSADHQLIAHPEDDAGEIDTSEVLKEPFGFDFLDAVPTTGPADEPRQALIAAYMRSGALVVFPLSNDWMPWKDRQDTLEDLSGLYSRDVAVHPDQKQVFITDYANGGIRVLDASVSTATDTKGQFWSLSNRGNLDLGSWSGAAQSDARAMLVSPDGSHLFVARRHIPAYGGISPAEILVISRTLAPTGAIHLEVVGALGLSGRPISMAYLRRAGDQPALLFVLCDDTGFLEVFDVENLLRQDAVVIGQSPYEIVLEEPPDDDEVGHYAYVSHYKTNRISVIGIKRDEPTTWLKVVGLIEGADQ